MATYVQGNVAGADAGSTSITTTLTGVAAGNLIVVYVGWEGATTTVTVGDGTSSFTGLDATSGAGGDLWGRWFYLLSSTSGNKTYTVTYGASRAFRRVAVMEFNSSNAWALDAGPSGGSGASSNPQSGNISTTGTEDAVLGACLNYANSADMDPQIADTNATGNVSTTSGDGIGMWYRILTGTASNIHAQNNAGWLFWVCDIVAFKAEAGGASSTPSLKRRLNILLRLCLSSFSTLFGRLLR